MDLPLDAPRPFAAGALPDPASTPATSDSPLDLPPRHHHPRLSVVMATFRRPDLLVRCLDALLAQTLPARAYEIVVVDDGHTEDTRAAVDAVARRSRAVDGPDVRYFESQGTRGPAGARNRGWRVARAEMIAFTDDDTLPDRDWLRAGEAALSPPERVAAWGRVHVPLPVDMTDHARNTAGLENAVFVTANAFVRRHALIAVDGFDERFTRAWREDTDLYFSLVSRYQPSAVAPAGDALVLHPVRPAPFGISVSQQKNLLFDALLYRKHPEQYLGHVPRRHAPPLYYAIVACTLGALPMAAASPGVALGLASLAVGMCLGFAARRLRGLRKTPSQVADMVLTSFAIPFLSLFWRLAGAWRWRVPFF